MAQSDKRAETLTKYCIVQSRQVTLANENLRATFKAPRRCLSERRYDKRTTCSEWGISGVVRRGPLEQ
ncbi:hypothetical protein AAFF_G00399580 [Aldrovandia affinis]|uniref:Uncharacterized protein n=1 Tax=Aldrovandia affinis TaxID=143900 RepID=A0AAD7SD37_9TELE|nr:hypothetical protein AAFF_G00399580 [Aldrovandia affinis]